MRQICALVSEHFRGLLLQMEAEKQSREEETRQVRAKMLKRLSTSEVHRTSPRATRDHGGKKKQQAKKSPGRAGQEEVHTPPSRASTLGETLENLEAELAQEEDSLALEIGRHFAAITKEPSHRCRGRDGNLKRLSSGGSASRTRIKRHDSLCDSTSDLVSPLRVSIPGKHNGNVLTQDLEDTTGVHLKQNQDFLAPKKSQRASLVDMLSAAVTRRPSKGRKNKSTQSRFSMYLEKMEEGEKETRIDGDGSTNFLVQTTMGDKETAILGEDGKAELLPASQLSGDLLTSQGTTTTSQDSTTFSPPPPPDIPAPPPPPPDVPAPPPPPGAPAPPRTPVSPPQKEDKQEEAAMREPCAGEQYLVVVYLELPAPSRFYLHCFIVVYLHCFIVVYLHCFIVVYLHCFIVVYLHCFIVVYLHCFIVVYLHCVIVVYLHCFIVVYLHCFIVVYLHCFVVVYLHCVIVVYLHCFIVVYLHCFIVVYLHCVIVVYLHCVIVVYLHCVIVVYLHCVIVVYLHCFIVFIMSIHLVSLFWCVDRACGSRWST